MTAPERAVSDTHRETVLDWRLAEVRRAGLAFSLGVERVRGEPTQGDTEPEHRVGVRLTARW